MHCSLSGLHQYLVCCRSHLGSAEDPLGEHMQQDKNAAAAWSRDCTAFYL